jgi:dinuclear metal center YbgI/SA1388 family protein
MNKEFICWSVYYMKIRVRDVFESLNCIAPFSLTSDWDNSGLQVGDLTQEVKSILLCLDVTEAVVKEAIEKKCQLIISHHPLLFKPLKKIDFSSKEGQLIQQLIKHDMNLIACHTNFDRASYGVSEALASTLGLHSIQKLTTQTAEPYFKLVVFVPLTHLEIVRQAISDAGAGYIGHYAHCTFKVDGEGTFLPLEHTNPYIGQEGQLTKVKESRLETIISKKQITQVLEALRAVHPYEEIAYDVYALSNRVIEGGLGCIGELSEPMTLKRFMSHVKEKLNVQHVQYAGDLQSVINKVAVCGGAGKSLLNNAAAEADAYLTGELGYHEGEIAKNQGVNLIVAGHFATEIVALDYLQDSLSKQLQENVTIEISENALDFWDFE